MKELLASKLKRYEHRFPNTVKFILDNYAGNIRCFRCGSLILKEPKNKQYPYQCMHCDENMFCFEVHKSAVVLSEEEIENLFQETLNILQLDPGN